MSPLRLVTRYRHFKGCAPPIQPYRCPFSPPLGIKIPTSTAKRQQLYSQTNRRGMPESRSQDALVWIDCEMTGLNTEKDVIMSIACFITDYKLDVLDETGYEAIIGVGKDQLDAMGEWCQKHHGQSGLTRACLESSTTPEQAAEGLLKYIQKYVPERRRALLAGNTVHADKMFLVKEPWSKIPAHLHHRILDVSAIKEAARRWAPDDLLKKTPQKAGKHEARADILESIEEARFYQKHFFEKPGS